MPKFLLWHTNNNYKINTIQMDKDYSYVGIDGPTSTSVLQVLLYLSSPYIIMPPKNVWPQSEAYSLTQYNTDLANNYFLKNVIAGIRGSRMLCWHGYQTKKLMLSYFHSQCLVLSHQHQHPVVSGQQQDGHSNWRLKELCTRPARYTQPLW